jgi:hypothetical protein
MMMRAVDADLAALRFAREPAELLPRGHVAHAVGRQAGPPIIQPRVIFRQMALVVVME